jgi:hypothetical protein
MLVKRSLLGALAFVAVLVAVTGCRDQAIVQRAAGAQVAVPLPFEAKFETANDFYGRFDYGLSGLTPAGSDDPNVPGAGGVFPLHGDHDMSCGGPTTVRDVTVTGEQWTGSNFPNINFDQLFWFCAPGGDPAKGHMMTAITTLGYNLLWFSPKPEFTGITKVCWDINETTQGGKWTEVQFVDHADATRYPTGSHLTGPNAAAATARGTGGFDLGYTEPNFRPEATGGDSVVGPNTGLQPRSGNLAGLRIDAGTVFSWFQGQDTFTATGVGWPGLLPNQGGNGGPITDKAARYTTCIENMPANQIQITNNRPDGPRAYTIPGQIPQDARRVVFHDSEYDGPKRGGYSPTNLTWHWDNIQIHAAAATQGPHIELAAPASNAPSASVPASAGSVPASATTAPAEVEPSKGATIAAGNLVGFGVTVAALALAVVFWPTRGRRRAN